MCRAPLEHRDLTVVRTADEQNEIKDKHALNHLIKVPADFSFGAELPLG